MESYLCVQVGLTGFKWNEEKKVYEFVSFNFYVYPFSEYGKKTSGFASNNVRFLRDNGFDFNKTFSQGIVLLP